MSYINTYTFKAEIGKTALMGFIATVPPELFCFVISKTGDNYGHFIGDDVIEYFTNEFPVKSLEIVPFEKLKELERRGCLVWGNKEILAG
ncbi:MAG TPA: hypothetical protein VFR58_13410 [Flavisolibacter sp.]|nr:hypothetical protein [Flavisolibacter sp.]